MTKARIASELYRMKREGLPITEIEGEIHTPDELLTDLLGREVGEDEGQEFLRPKQC